MKPDIHSAVIPFALHPLGMLEVLLELGLELRDLLDGTTIAPSDFTRKNFVISLLQLINIIENAQKKISTTSLGLLLGSSIAWRYHGRIGDVIYSSPCLAEAYFSFRRYLQIAQPGYPLFSSKADYFFDHFNYVVIQLEPADEQVFTPSLVRFELEFRIAVLARLFRACGNPGASDKRIRVGVNYPAQKCMTEFQKLLQADLEFNAAIPFIAVHKDFFLSQWRDFQRPFFQKMIDECEHELERIRKPFPVSERLSWLMSFPCFHDIRLDAAADLMAMLPRTLARRLADEGKCFRSLQCSLRAQRVKHNLKNSRLPQEDLAQMLGFSCASSLRRAAKCQDDS